jgi:hypothetical protein
MPWCRSRCEPKTTSRNDLMGRFNARNNRIFAVPRRRVQDVMNATQFKSIFIEIEFGVPLYCHLRTMAADSRSIDGVARAQLRCSPEGIWSVEPHNIEDCLGPFENWGDPPRAAPIRTAHPQSCRADAERAFVEWAEVAFAHRWKDRKGGQNATKRSGWRWHGTLLSAMPTGILK